MGVLVKPLAPVDGDEVLYIVPDIWYIVSLQVLGLTAIIDRPTMI